MHPEVISKICSMEEALVREQVQEASASPRVNALGARLWEGVKERERDWVCLGDSERCYLSGIMEILQYF